MFILICAIFCVLYGEQAGNDAATKYYATGTPTAGTIEWNTFGLVVELLSECSHLTLSVGCLREAVGLWSRKDIIKYNMNT